MKTNRNKLNLLLVALLLGLAALACNLGDETDKANKLVDEGNAAVEEAKKQANEGDEKKTKMMEAVSAIHTKDDLAHARDIAREVIAAYDKAKNKCDEAAKKFEEASKLKVKDKFKEYLTLKMKEFQKRAEAAEAAKATPQALIDSESRSAFESQTKSNNEKVDKLVAESRDLAEQADKIRSENKDIFKS